MEQRRCQSPASHRERLRQTSHRDPGISDRTELTRRWAFAAVGLAAGFSGVAVIVSILSGVALLIAEVAMVAAPLVVVIIVARRAPRPVARHVGRVVRAGLLAGFAATIAYDATRTALSVYDPSPYNPFEAIRQFGLGIMPADAGLPAVMATGFAIHVLNGSTFGVIYAVFFGRHVHTLRAALLGGAIWGLTLEFVQSILYPGWLGIPAVILREFLVISGLGHIAYGAALGVGVRRLLFRGSSMEEPRD